MQKEKRGEIVTDNSDRNIQLNMYCDESCHLAPDYPFDTSTHMVLGGVLVKKDRVRKINQEIRLIKKKHGLSAATELKWTKISRLTYPVYEELITYFFSSEDMMFRALIAPKNGLDHVRYHQTHDDWYYKMYFELLDKISVIYAWDKMNVYLDIKETNSANKIKKLHQFLADSKNRKGIQRIQVIRSDEVEIMQITDVLIGALGYLNRTDLKDRSNAGKMRMVELIRRMSKLPLTCSTGFNSRKMNIFLWECDHGKV